MLCKEPEAVSAGIKQSGSREKRRKKYTSSGKLVCLRFSKYPPALGIYNSRASFPLMPQISYSCEARFSRELCKRLSGFFFFSQHHHGTINKREKYSLQPSISLTPKNISSNNSDPALMKGQGLKIPLTYLIGAANQKRQQQQQTLPLPRDLTMSLLLGPDGIQ